MWGTIVVAASYSFSSKGLARQGLFPLIFSCRFLQCDFFPVGCPSPLAYNFRTGIIVCHGLVRGKDPTGSRLAHALRTLNQMQRWPSAFESEAEVEHGISRCGGGAPTTWSTARRLSCSARRLHSRPALPRATSSATCVLVDRRSSNLSWPATTSWR